MALAEGGGMSHVLAWTESDSGAASGKRAIMVVQSPECRGRVHALTRWMKCVQGCRSESRCDSAA